uniref:C-type isolectin Sp-CL4 n=1 Tax=Scorpaena plumieri TaxID=274700 RepID=LEC4_SCOPL|nr:RecName: Full=C-type isolectin Sp-CL4 [Scorpaena plumieri]
DAEPPSPAEECAAVKMESCGDDWLYIDENRKVKYFETPKTFQEAQDHCESEDGNLVAMHTEFQKYVVACLSWIYNHKLHRMWIGAGRSEGETQNIDGSDFDYAKWKGGQPDNFGGNEDCIEANFIDWGYLNDVECSEKLPFMCA